MHRQHGWIGRKDRQNVAIEAVVHRSDGSQTNVRLTDFSDEGCRIEGDRDFRIGEHVQIEIPDMGKRHAQVRWALLGSAGVKFFSDGDV